jgi:uncharacterized membrane protein
VNRSEIEKFAETAFLEGKSHQEVYNELARMNDMKAQRLAEILRKIPDLKKRRKYRLSNMVLCSLLTLIVLSRLAVLPDILNGPLLLMIHPLLFTFIPAVLIYGVYTYKPYSHMASGFFLVLGFVLSIANVFTGTNIYVFLDMAIMIFGAAVAFYLNGKLATDFTFNSQADLSQREALIHFDE